jgi:hypothetical protein
MKSVYVLHVLRMSKVRTDAHNGAVLLVQLFDLPHVLELVGVELVVEFIPEG